MRRPSGNKPRILHVEDDESVLEIVSVLVDGSADISAAMSVYDARVLLEKDTFDLVILDLMLPDGDGGCLLPLLNKPGKASTPVIVFSAKDVSHEITKKIQTALVKTQTSNEKLLKTILSTIEKSQATG